MSERQRTAAAVDLNALVFDHAEILAAGIERARSKYPYWFKPLARIAELIGWEPWRTASCGGVACYGE